MIFFFDIFETCFPSLDIATFVIGVAKHSRRRNTIAVVCKPILLWWCLTFKLLQVFVLAIFIWPSKSWTQSVMVCFHTYIFHVAVTMNFGTPKMIYDFGVQWLSILELKYAMILLFIYPWTFVKLYYLPQTPPGVGACSTGSVLFFNYLQLMMWLFVLQYTLIGRTTCRLKIRALSKYVPDTASPYEM